MNTMDEIKLAAELRRDEGEKLRAYLDSLGYWTIGVGHLIDPRKKANPAPFCVDLRNGGVITRAQSEALLLTDMRETANELDRRLPWWRKLTNVRQRVLMNMAFNLGVSGLLGFKNTLAMASAGDYVGAAGGMLDSKWAKQVGARADRLAAMMIGG